MATVNNNTRIDTINVLPTLSTLNTTSDYLFFQRGLKSYKVQLATLGINDAGKLTTGTLSIDRIANNSITENKFATAVVSNAATGNSIVKRNSSGNITVGDITMSSSADISNGVGELVRLGVVEDTVDFFANGNKIFAINTNGIDLVTGELTGPANFTISNNSGEYIKFDNGAQSVEISVLGDADKSFLISTNQIQKLAGSTEDCRLILGLGRNASGNSYLDLVGDTAYPGDSFSEPGMRIIRDNGGGSNIIHNGGGNNLNITTRQLSKINFSTNDTERWYIDSDDGHFIPSSDNTYDIGSSGSAVRLLYTETGTVESSDKRLKTDISTSVIGLKFLNDLNPVSYKFINGTSDRTHYGLIAQELEEAIKKHKIETKDFAPLVIGDDEDKTYGIRYSELISPIIKSIQELSKENENLKKKNKSLENRLKKLEDILLNEKGH